MQPICRRRFLQLSALGAIGLYFRISPANSAFASMRFSQSASPVADIDSFPSSSFNGDDVRRPHEILWNLENYIRSKGGRPASRENAEIVVVGGGMAGLLAAYHLRDHKPVLLEQAERFGGNSKGERYQSSRFSIGAAYVGIPENGSDQAKLFDELGISGYAKRESAKESRVLFQGLQSLWSGETNPAAQHSAQLLHDELVRIYEGEIAEIPWTSESPSSALKELDRKTAWQWLHEKIPEPHPHLLEFLQLYSWSSLGGSLEELSAAQWLCFLAAETQGIMAFPGGNSAITNALYEKLGGSSNERLQASAIALEVKEVDEKVEVLFEDAAGKLRVVRAKAVVMACPKYAARHLLRSVAPPERNKLWELLPYRAYIVGNFLLKEKLPAPAFDPFCVRGQALPPPSQRNRTDRMTDLVLASWTESDAGRSILTVYRPYPLDGTRSHLVSDEQAIKRLQGEMEKELPHWLTQLGYPADAVEAMRWTRWGHAIPLARAGLLADGTIEQIGAPLGKRIFFANQDDFMSPAFETCFAAARRAAQGVRTALTG